MAFSSGSTLQQTDEVAAVASSGSGGGGGGGVSTWDALSGKPDGLFAQNGDADNFSETILPTYDTSGPSAAGPKFIGAGEDVEWRRDPASDIALEVRDTTNDRRLLWLDDNGRLHTRRDQEAFADGGGSTADGVNSLLQVEDPNEVLTTDAASLKFTGSGVSVIQSGDDITVDISGGSGSDIDIEKNQGTVVGGATGLSFEGSGIDDVTNDGDGTATVQISKGSSTEVQQDGTPQVSDVTTLDFVQDFSVATPTSGEAEVSLENDTVTVAGNAVSLGGSTSVSHADLSNIGSSDHHTRYSDSEAVSAVESHGNALAIDISGDADTLDGVQGSNYARRDGTGEVTTFGDGTFNDQFISIRNDIANGGMSVGLDTSLNGEGGGMLLESGENKVIAFRADRNSGSFGGTTPHGVVSTAGNWGFGGVTSPSYAVDINGTLNASGDGYFGGNVAIGTTSPSYLLDVSGTARATSLRVDGYQLTKDGSGRLSVSEPNGSEVLRLTDSGTLLAAGDVVAFGLSGGGGPGGSSGLQADAPLTLDTSTDPDTIGLSVGSGLTVTNGTLKADGSVGVSSVFGRSGDVTAQAGDYSASQINNFDSSAVDALQSHDGTDVDADTLDGVQGSNYARVDVAETFTSGLYVDGGNNADEDDIFNIASILNVHDGGSKQLLGNAKWSSVKSQWEYTSGGPAWRLNLRSDPVEFLVASSGTAGNEATFTTVWSASSNGEIGLGGVTAPSYPVDVSGDLNISGNYRQGGNLLDAADLAGQDGTAGQVLTTDGTSATWDTLQHSELSGIGTSDHHVRPSAGDGLSESFNTFTVNESQVDHDSLNQYNADEHIDHSAVTIAAGTALSGGGDLTASRTLNVSGPFTGIPFKTAGDDLEWQADANNDLILQNTTDAQTLLRVDQDTGTVFAAGDVVAFGLDGGGGTTNGGGFSIAGDGLTSSDGETIAVDYGAGLAINNGVLEVDGSVGVSSVFGRTSDVTAQSGDYSASQISNFDTEAVNAVGASTPFSNSDLSNSSVTVAGNSVALGGSTSISHGDLSNIGSDDHHTRYSDSEAISAINTDSDHGSTASHNYYTDADARAAINNDSDHGSTASHNYTTSASGLSDVSPDSVADAHHAVFEPADYNPVSDVESHGNTLAIDISGDADTVDGYEGSDLAALSENEVVTGNWIIGDGSFQKEPLYFRETISDGRGVAIGFDDTLNGGSGGILIEGGSGKTIAFRADRDSGSFGGTTPHMVVGPTGNVGIGGTSSYALEVFGDVRSTGEVEAFLGSDRRLKTSLDPLDSALDKVGALTGYAFDWRGADEVQPHKRGETDVGLIAQDVEDVLPEAVKTLSDGHSEGYKAVEYDKVVPLLVEAIKNLQSQVQELR